MSWDVIRFSELMALYQSVQFIITYVIPRGVTLNYMITRNIRKAFPRTIAIWVIQKKRFVERFGGWDKIACFMTHKTLKKTFLKENLQSEFSHFLLKISFLGTFFNFRKIFFRSEKVWRKFLALKKFKGDL